MKIICIGRNYVEHARELKNPLPRKPVFFLKPSTSLLIKNRPFFYPEFSENIHYETEIVLKVSKVGKYIQKEFALSYIDSIGLGIDFTARDLQQTAKENGLPWEIAKAFDHSAPVSDHFTSVKKFKNLGDIHFHLDMNGERMQTGTTADMIFSFDDIISYVSQYMTLRTGDLIFTGTPAGVGPVRIGDVLEGFLEERKILHCEIR